jgi:hypothetical protein
MFVNNLTPNIYISYRGVRAGFVEIFLIIIQVDLHKPAPTLTKIGTWNNIIIPSLFFNSPIHTSNPFSIY